ncbi:hypothetical protein BaRGS_00028028 [Batillaria attramentaria]|uniref:CUB domain-containing protein n=1 Tax=Batillaria attramentaria TaxID=370345 RepID=A0ABD0K1N1_9CAEN
MEAAWGNPTLVLALSLLTTVFTQVTGDVLTACYDGSNKTIDINCGPGAMVRILKTFYGFSSHGDCAFTEGDCTLQEQESFDCVGHSACSVPLKWVEQGGVILPLCKKRSNYFQVEYQCVPKSEMHDICQHTRLTTQSGHIVTPNYPMPYYRKLHCNMTIVVAHSQRLRLNIVTMELTARGKTDCADWLYFNDKFHSLTLCGKRSNIWYDMHSNFLHIELQSTSTTRSRGFWLYYEAFPPLPTTEAPPVEESTASVGAGSSIILTTLASVETHAVTQQKPTPIPIYRGKEEKSRGTKSLPFAAIAGGVIGTLSLVLIILLMLLLIKWLKERRYLKDEKFLEIRNPAFRSSGDFNETNNYYC